MARSKYIYLVVPKMPGNDGLPIAAFTVKYESQSWVRKHALGIDAFERYRFVDGCDGDIVGSRTLVPWENTDG